MYQTRPMYLTLNLCRFLPRKAGMLSVVFLLSLGAGGQSLTRKALLDINRQLSRPIADTTRIRLLLAVSAHATAQIERSTARDSALRFSKAALALSASIGYDSGIYRSYLQEIGVWAGIHNLVYLRSEEESDIDTVAIGNARALQRRFIAFVHRNGSWEQVGKAYTDAAFLYVGGDPRASVPLFDSAATYFRRSGNTIREAQALYDLALSYNDWGKYRESLPHYHRCIALLEPIGGRLLYSAYSLLGRAYGTLGGATIALKYHLKALQLAEAAGDTTDEMGAIHLFLGLTYNRIKNVSLAHEHFEKAYRIDRNYTVGHAGEFFSAALNLANAMIDKNPQESVDFLLRFREEYKHLITPKRALDITVGLMEAYAGMRDYTTAQRYCNEGMEDLKEVPNALYAHLSIGRFLIASHQYHAAEKYLIYVERTAKEYGGMSYLRSAYSVWYKIDSAKGDYLGALERFKLLKVYGDSMLSDNKAKEIALLEVEYETAKKEQAIALLTKDGELSRQQLAQSRLQKNSILAGLIVAMLISGLLFHQYRTKKKNNTELTKRQQEIQRTNAVLQKTILEKEWLLKEVNHRVKNNLQTVVSLLESQSYMLQNSEAVSAIHDSQNRVHAMSLIHQKLYQTEHRTSINMAIYLSELVEYLRDSFSTGRLIQFQLSIEPIELDVSQAIPMGLILNEAITNTIKYAFPGEAKENCRVVISMQQDAERNVILSIADNGRGLPPDYDNSSRFGMGLKLIHGLASEINGTCNIYSDNQTGVSIEIAFNACPLLTAPTVSVEAMAWSTGPGPQTVATSSSWSRPRDYRPW